MDALKPTSSRPTVLVVDDEPANLEILARLLKDRYDVRLARSGDKALAIARQHRPDLVLLDVVMPGLDGHEVCRQLMSDPHFGRPPVIFLTARGAAEDETLGFSLGAVDYIH